MDTRNIRFEFARSADVQALALMSRDLIEHGLGWGYRPESIARMMDDPETVALVARDGTRAVGFAIMTFGEERCHLVLLAVNPTHQRRGIARSMLAWLVKSAQTAGIASLHVELRADNEAAYALYRAAGFSETLRVRGYYQGRETAVKMVRMLRVPGYGAQRRLPPPVDRR